MDSQFDVLIDTYLENKIGIDAGFLSETLSHGLQQTILQLQEDGKMYAAGIGNNETKDANQKMRGDKIYWLDRLHNNVHENSFFDLIPTEKLTFVDTGTPSSRCLMRLNKSAA